MSRLPIESGKSFNIPTDGICHCPYQTPCIYIGMEEDQIKNIPIDKCKLCGGKIIVPTKLKGGIIKQNDKTKNRARSKSKSRRL